MVKQVVFLVMAAMAMGACSTEQNVMELVRMSDVVNSGCTSSFSATESRPEYYKAEKEKSAKMLVSVDAKGVAHFQVTDLQANCAVNGFSPQVYSQDGEIRIVLIPLGDSTIEALDAPSGTALALADSINEACNEQYEYVYDRSKVRKKRDKKELGISAVRGGTIVGEHEVIFAGIDEVIEFKHTAYSKSVFAKGAVEAGKFLKGKPAGMYDMADVIG